MSTNVKGFLTFIQILFILLAVWGFIVLLFSQQERYDDILLDVIKGSALFIGGVLTSFYVTFIKDKGAF